MLRYLVGSELQYHFAQRSMWAACAVYFLLGILGNFGRFGSAEIHANSPFAVAFFLTLLSVSSLFVVTVFAANALLRDSRYRMEEIVFSTGVDVRSFLIARFLALFFVSGIPMLLTAIGLAAGSLFVESQKLGPFSVMSYLQPVFIFLLPNVALCSAFLFAIAVLTRSLAGTYVGGILLYVLYFAGSMLGNSPVMAGSVKKVEDGLMATLMDPFGLAGYFIQTRSWTVVEKNQLTILPEGDLLLNRLLWTSAAVVLVAVVSAVHSFKVKQRAGPARKKTTGGPPDAPPVFYSARNPVQGPAFLWKSIFTRATLEIAGVVKGIPFKVILVLWLGISAMTIVEEAFRGFFGVRYYPESGIIINAILQSGPLLCVLILIFYGAFITFREKTSGMDELVDSTPLSTIALVSGKLLALISIVVIFVSGNILLGMLIQVSNGQPVDGPIRYFSLFYYQGLPLALLAVLILFVYALIPGRYMGMIVAGAFAVVILKADRLGLEHYLYRFASTPQLTYTEMTGFGHYAGAFFWYMLYSFGWAIVLFSATTAFWRRGQRQHLTATLKETSFQLRIFMLAGLFVSFLSGAFIYYNTNRVQNYAGSDELAGRSAAYEKLYGPFDSSPRPVIVYVKNEVDLYPETQRYRVRGSYRLVNKTGLPIDSILVGVDPEVNSADIVVSGARQVYHDELHRTRWFKADNAWAPGAEIVLEYTLEVIRTGFTSFNSENAVVKNGSYVELEKFVPHIGYDPGRELTDPHERMKRGLTPKKPARHPREPTDTEYEWTHVETIVSTEAPETAVTIGELKRQWEEGDRRNFHYMTKAPVRFMFAVSSSRYDKLHEKVDGVNVEVYFHKAHRKNAVEMMRTAGSSLNYLKKKFGPYGYEHLRMVEIPLYKGAATAYPGVVFVTEKNGFLTDTAGDRSVNPVMAMTAHEVSHEWWGYTVEPSDHAGRRVMTETLAQYSEWKLLSQMGKSQSLQSYYDAHLDYYMSSRGYAGVELPLYVSDGPDQAYVFYQKGALVMRAIEDLLGEERVNRALRHILEQKSFPHGRPSTLDLISALCTDASERERQLIHEWMERVTFYDLSVVSAVVSSLDSHRFELSFEVMAGKSGVDGTGKGVLPLDEELQIAVYGDPEAGMGEESQLYLAKHRIKTGASHFSVIVDQKPRVIAIDPGCLRIDRNRSDNFLAIEE